MSEIVDFILNHWQLSSLLMTLVAAYALFEMMSGSASAGEVSPEAAVDLYNHENAVLLDFRSLDLFKVGHIVGATHVDDNESEKKLKKFNKYAQRPVIVITEDGKNAKQYVAKLAQHGLTKVLSLTGGIKGWQSAGLPLTK